MCLEWKDCACVLIAVLCSSFRLITLLSPIYVLFTVSEALWPRLYLLPKPLHQLLWWVLVSLFYRGWKFWGLHKMNCKITKVLKGRLCTAQTSKNQKRIWTQCYLKLKTLVCFFFSPSASSATESYLYCLYSVCPNLLPDATVTISTLDPLVSLACCDTLIRLPPFQN